MINVNLKSNECNFSWENIKHILEVRTQLITIIQQNSKKSNKSLHGYTVTTTQDTMLIA